MKFTIGLWNNHLVKESSLKGPPLLIKSVEFEAPYFPIWPPKSHKLIFFDSPNESNFDKYAEEVISRFMKRAFRRPLNQGEIDRYLSFWKSIKDDFDNFQDSIKEVLVAVLCSPNFIYLFPRIPLIARISERESKGLGPKPLQDLIAL